MLNDYESLFKDLVKRSGKLSMNLRRTRTLCIESYKIHEKSAHVSFSTKGRIQSPKIWNVLPFHIKSKEKFRLLKKL